MTHDYEIWQKILKSSGGTLAPEMCNHYKIEWTFKPSERPVMKVATKGDIDELVQLIPDNGAHKTLGYKMSPLNGPDIHLKHWREKKQILSNITQ